MKNWKRITLVIFVLIGGTASFAYWSLNQFNNMLDSLSAVYLASTLTAYPSFKRDADLATTSLEISGELATSTDSTSPPRASSGQATSTDPELSFTFPQKGAKVYIGCTYPISWQSSTVINSLVTTLVDAGTRETMGPIASGLVKENMIERDLQNLTWKVGNVWPGSYYIKISKINDVDTETRSRVFMISAMPKGTNKEEKINICRGSI